MSFRNLRVCVIDFNFLLMTTEHVIVNECTIHNLNDSVSQTYHVGCSKRLMQEIKSNHLTQCNFNTDHFHKLPLGYGNVGFRTFCKSLKSEVARYDVILTKGDQKMDLINGIVNRYVQVFDLAHFGCPSIGRLTSMYHVVQRSCIYHKAGFTNCTAYKTLLYSRWLHENRADVSFYLRVKLGLSVARFVDL